MSESTNDIGAQFYATKLGVYDEMVAKEHKVLPYWERFMDSIATLGSGQLTLVYDQARKALQQWIVTDGKGRKTTVSLENLQPGIEPDPKLFVVKIKRDNKNGP